MATKPSEFAAGRYYGGKFAGDNGSFEFKVISRSPKMLTLFGRHSQKDCKRTTVKRFHISRDFHGIEYVWPFGKEGQSPCLTAAMIREGK